jgi:4-hydroxy-tetrahydrodipicolinate reductase
VPTLDGHVVLKIPAETQSGRVFRLQGQGREVGARGGERGDLFCRVVVETPVQAVGGAARAAAKIRRDAAPGRRAARAAAEELSRRREGVLLTREPGVIRTVIAGATGRMGRQLLRLLPEFPNLKLTGAVAAPGSVELGRDALELAGLAPGGVFVSAELGTLLGDAELVLDFSSAAVTGAHLRACVGARVPLLLGTTGWPATFEQELAEAAKVIPLLVAANTSRGINVLLELVRQAAAALPAEYDIEISETHHRHKLDAPSGTALALAQAAAAGRGQSGPAVARRITARHQHTTAVRPDRLCCDAGWGRGR